MGRGRRVVMASSPGVGRAMVRHMTPYYTRAHRIRPLNQLYVHSDTRRMFSNRGRGGAYYLTGHLPELHAHDFDPDTSKGMEQLEKLRDASKGLLAAQHTGMLRHAYLNSLMGQHRLRLPREAKGFKQVIRQIPEVVHMERKFAEDTKKDVIYPAYYPKLIRAVRPISDYDPSTHYGAVAWRQLRDSVATELELNVQGLRADTLWKALHRYGHRLERDVLMELIGRMPETAKWMSSTEYPEYDRVVLVDTSFVDFKKRLPVRKKAPAWQKRLHDRFSLWYDDPFPVKPSQREQKSELVGTDSDPPVKQSEATETTVKDS